MKKNANSFEIYIRWQSLSTRNYFGWIKARQIAVLGLILPIAIRAHEVKEKVTLATFGGTLNVRKKFEMQRYVYHMLPPSYKAVSFLRKRIAHAQFWNETENVVIINVWNTVLCWRCRCSTLYVRASWWNLRQKKLTFIFVRLSF